MVDRRRDARSYPLISFQPGSGTGIQIVKGRTQPYIVWNNTEIEQFCFTENQAFFVLQEVLDELRTGLDWEEEEEDEGEEFLGKKSTVSEKTYSTTTNCMFLRTYRKTSSW